MSEPFIKKVKHNSVRSCQEKKALLFPSTLFLGLKGRAPLGADSLNRNLIPSSSLREEDFLPSLVPAPCLAPAVLANVTAVYREGPRSYQRRVIREPVNHLLPLPRGSVWSFLKCLLYSIFTALPAGMTIAKLWKMLYTWSFITTVKTVRYLLSPSPLHLTEWQLEIYPDSNLIFSPWQCP